MNNRDTDIARIPAWKTRRERGSFFLIWLTIKFANLLGRIFGRIGSRVAALYYFVASPTARRASYAYLTQVMGKKPTLALRLRHLQRFAQVVFDAFLFLGGHTRPFRVDHTGHHYLANLRDQKRSAILLGAHLGSFYAMRTQSSERNLPLYALVYTKHAKTLNDVFQKLDPKGAATLIDLSEDPQGALIRVKELAEQGALIAVMADRVGDVSRSVEVDFLGRKARFPTGPFLTASILRLPVYLTVGLYFEPNHYDLYCEPFAEQIVLARTGRDAALKDYIQRYADRLAHYAKMAPDNWFNFYDFWE